MLETVSRKILEHITEQCLICCDVGIPCSAKQACIDPSSLIFPFQVGLYGTAFAKKLLDFQLLVIILFFAQQMKSSADRLIKKKKSISFVVASSYQTRLYGRLTKMHH